MDYPDDMEMEGLAREDRWRKDRATELRLQARDWENGPPDSDDEEDEEEEEDEDE